MKYWTDRYLRRAIRHCHSRPHVAEWNEVLHSFQLMNESKILRWFKIVREPLVQDKHFLAELRRIASAYCIAWSVCRSVTVVSPAKTAEPIEMPFWMLSRVDPINHVWGCICPSRKGTFRVVSNPLQTIRFWGDWVKGWAVQKLSIRPKTCFFTKTCHIGVAMWSSPFRG